MIAITCPHCQSGFELDAVEFPPGTTFSCGQCQGLVQVPAAPAATPAPPPTPAPAPRMAPPPPRKPAPAAPPAAGKPAPRAGAPAARSRPAAAPPRQVRAAAGGEGVMKSAAQRAAERVQPTKAGPSPAVLYGGIGGVVVLAIVLIIAVSGPGGSETDNEQTPVDGNSNTASAQSNQPEESPYDQAFRAARTTGSLADLLALGDMAWNKMEAAAEGSEEYSLHRNRMRWAYKQVLATKDDHPVANERRGNVLFDADEAQKWLANEGLSQKLRSDLEFELLTGTEEFLKAGKRKIWLSPDVKAQRAFVETWTQMRRLVAESSVAAEGRANDPFYRSAQAKGESVARELSTGGNIFLKAGVTDGAFHVHVQKPYVILVQKDPSFGDELRVSEEWGRILQDLDRQFVERYSDALRPGYKPKPRIIVGLRDVTEYAKYMRRTDPSAQIRSAAHYEPWNKRIICPIAQSAGPDSKKSSNDLSREVLFHEGTHQIVDAYMANMAGGRYAGAKVAQGLWFSEGIAEFFGAHGLAGYDDRKRRIYELGLLLPDSIKLVQSARKAGDALNVRELLRYSRARYQQDLNDVTRGRKTRIAYAQGWSLCYLLQQWKADEYGEGFMKYFKLEMEGRSGTAAFRSAFGSDAIAKIQKDLDAMMDELGAAVEAGKISNGKLEK